MAQHGDVILIGGIIADTQLGQQRVLIQFPHIGLNCCHPGQQARDTYGAEFCKEIIEDVQLLQREYRWRTIRLSNFRSPPWKPQRPRKAV